MKRLNKKGFTLVELLAVIIILGLLMVVAASVMGNVQDNAKKSSLETEAKKILTSLTNEAKSLALLGEFKTTDLSDSFKGSDGDYYYSATVDGTTGDVTAFAMCYGKFYIAFKENTTTLDTVSTPEKLNCSSSSVNGLTPGVTVPES